MSEWALHFLWAALLTLGLVPPVPSRIRFMVLLTALVVALLGFFVSLGVIALT